MSKKKGMTGRNEIALNVIVAIATVFVVLALTSCKPEYIHDSSTGCVYERGTPEDSPGRQIGSCAQWDRVDHVFEGVDVEHR